MASPVVSPLPDRPDQVEHPDQAEHPDHAGLADQSHQPAMEARCRWCGRRFTVGPGPGRPRLYCRQGCRQQAHLARKLAAAHGLGPDDLVVSRTQLEELQGRLYCLQAALEDVDRDLAEGRGPAAVAAALEWLLENARPLATCWIEPRVTD